jgi:hypothetical protein
VQTSCTFSRRPIRAAPALAAKRPVGWREVQNRAAISRQRFCTAQYGDEAPGREWAPASSLSGAGRTCQGRLRRRLRRRPLTEPARSPGFRSYREPGEVRNG